MVQPKKPITSAPPPIHSILFISFISIALSIYLYTSSCLETIDNVATLDTFSTSLVFFKSGEVGNEAIKLGWVRVGIGMFVWSVSLYNCFLWEGYVQLTGYLPHSKLTREPLRMKGIQTLAPFTTWSWNILGSSYLLNGLLSLYVGYNYHTNTSSNSIILKTLQSSSPKLLQYTLRFALLLFETASPCTILVSSVIAYAIWPKVLASSNNSNNNPNPTKDLKAKPMLVQHTANVFFAFLEVGLLGGLPVRLCDFCVAPLFGMVYVLFSWSMMKMWRIEGDKDDDVTGKIRRCTCPQFLYFFLDTTLGKGSTYGLMVLLGVLLGAYGLFCMADGVFGGVVRMVVEWGLGGVVGRGDLVEVVVRLGMVLGASSIFCRFRD